MSEVKTYMNGEEVAHVDGLEILEWINDRVVVRSGNKTHELEVSVSEHDPKQVKVFFNGHNYTIRIKDRTDLILEEMGMDVVKEKSATDLMAPMPGLVLKVLVSAGEEVQKGTPLLVLEAMKMENMIRAQSDVTVKEIQIKNGDTVEKGQLMITFKK